MVLLLLKMVHQFPPAFINIKSEDTGRPQTVDNYIWAESNLNMRDSNGFLIVKGN